MTLENCPPHLAITVVIQPRTAGIVRLGARVAADADQHALALGAHVGELQPGGGVPEGGRVAVDASEVQGVLPGR